MASDTRRHGDGSVYHRPAYTDAAGRLHPAKWVASISTGTGSSRKRRYKYADSEAEARRLARQLRDEKARDPRRSFTPDQRVNTYLAHWLETRQQSGILRPSSLRFYAMFIEHASKELSGLTLKDLEPEDVQQMVNRARASHSARWVHQLKSVLHNALEDAVKHKRLPSNPAENIDLPRLDHRERQTLSLDQARTFLTAVAGDPLEALYRVALSCGLRPGELLGLRWQDVDLDKGVLRVRKNLQRGTAGLTLMDPKTKTGIRDVALEAATVAALRAHRARRGTVPLDGAYVFATAAGNPLMIRNVVRAFKAALRRAGLPSGIQFYDLRHTYGTLSLELGADIVTISQNMGHSDPRVTASNYLHPSTEVRRQAQERLGRALTAS